MIKLSGLKLNINASESDLVDLALKKAKMSRRDLKYFKLERKSLDARDKNNIFYSCTVTLSNKEQPKIERVYPKVNGGSVLVVGAGPAGLFCALDLLRYGFKVTLVERGLPVDEREKEYEKYLSTRILNTDCNIQFGEGGAGAFSDGKLNTQVGGELVKEVLLDFVSFGAPCEIEYISKPHIGSDNLKNVVKNMRLEIIRLGGKVLFSTKLTDLTISGGKVSAVYLNGEKQEFSEVVLAVGHSARDVYEVLNIRGVMMESKDFAVGVRIEHLQSDINLAQYGEKYAYNKNMPVADYKLTSNVNGRGVFTFCMCPGGYVMPSQSNKNTVVVNGMSNYLRNGENANSAIICQVFKKDFGEGLFDGVNYQKRLEESAFTLGGENYSAPVSLLGDFLKGENSTSFGKVKPTYALGVKKADLNKVLGENLSTSIKLGVLEMGKKIKGFDSYDAVLTAVESRTSSPVRVLRNEKLQSVSATNLYPCGEGCGYAGGITSAGADGKRVAKQLAIKYGAQFERN
ncbi:MAG: FAD-dependent oxidoreductase [Clostridia bacterium]|nr:FAD-dependent oxidoreductase [Clostridia bacterium]